ncbi:MAG: hypothetical protein ABIR18_12955 [Chitinophagaceae bacterium]
MMRRSVFFVFFIFISLLLPAQHKKGLSRLLPHYAKLQFAGGIGFLAAGAGYESKNKHFQTDIFYGYVPEKIGGIDIHSVTGKFTYTPFFKQLKHNMQLDWIMAGILFNYTFGHQYFLFSPEYYPLSYYGLPSAAHVGFFVGESIHYKKMSLYYELGTTDKDLGGYFKNTRAIPFFDIINIGIGTRYAFK